MIGARLFRAQRACPSRPRSRVRTGCAALGLLAALLGSATGAAAQFIAGGSATRSGATGPGATPDLALRPGSGPGEAAGTTVGTARPFTTLDDADPRVAPPRTPPRPRPVSRRVKVPVATPVRAVLRRTIGGPNAVTGAVQTLGTDPADPALPADPGVTAAAGVTPAAGVPAAAGGPGGATPRRRPFVPASDVLTTLPQTLSATVADPVGPALSRRPDPTDPYAPLGLRFGGLTLLPAFGQSLGYDTNPNRTFLRKGSVLSQTEAELGVVTDWSRNELTGALRGAYNVYPEVKGADRPEGSGRLGLRVDVSRDTQVDGEVHFRVDSERAGSADLTANVRERPIVATEGGSIGVSERFNRLVATLRGGLDRTDYQNATLSDGSILDQSDRAFTQPSVRGRLAYELKPGLTPFVEVQGDERVYDRSVDNNGYRRSSTGVGARAGAAFELTRLVTAEVSAGAIERRYDDYRLRNLTSPLVDASLVWVPTPITTVRASLSTSVDETTVPGSNGIRATRGALEVSHDLRRNLTITAGVSALENDYRGVAITERGYDAILRAEYRLTRSIALRASYTYERLKSSVPGSDYTANVMLIGLRLQP